MKNYNLNKKLQFSVYLTGGVLFFLQMMAWSMESMYGAPSTTAPNVIIAFIASLILMVAAFISLNSAQSGRKIAIVSLIFLGALYIPASRSLAPIKIDDMKFDSYAYIIIVGYLFLLAFSLFYPTRRKFSTPLMIIVIFTSLGFAVNAYRERLDSGEYAWPNVFCFNLSNDINELIVEDNPFTVSDEFKKLIKDAKGRSPWTYLLEHDTSNVPNKIKKLLKDTNIKGRLSWVYSTAGNHTGHQIIVITTGKIKSEKLLYHPKEGTIIYYHDAGNWITIPANAAIFKEYPAVLEIRGGLRQKIPRAGVATGFPYHWD